MEKQFKSIRAILQPPEFHMVGDGFRVHNFFPSQIDIEQTDPFFLMDYGSKWDVSPSVKPRGVGVHPHRGFETITIAYNGRVAHHDSAGNSGVIYEGDVQWMTAGSGILHKEYHEKEFSKKGGVFQMVQIWLNLPAKYKMTPPKYQALENNNMPRFILDNNKGHIEVIAGDYKTLIGPASTFSPVTMLNAKLSDGAKAEFRFNSTCNTGMLVVEGDIKVNDQKIAPEDHFILFGNDGEDIVIEALKDCIVLVISGKPINEPVASSGPFVMNTEAEIKQAYQDFRNGKFGSLED